VVVVAAVAVLVAVLHVVRAPVRRLVVRARRAAVAAVLAAARHAVPDRRVNAPAHCLALAACHVRVHRGTDGMMRKEDEETMDPGGGGSWRHWI